MLPAITPGWIIFTSITFTGIIGVTWAWRRASGRSTKGVYRAAKRRTRKTNRGLVRTKKEWGDWWDGPDMARRRETTRRVASTLTLWATLDGNGEPRPWCSRWVGGTHRRAGSTYTNEHGTQVTRRAHDVTTQRRPAATGNKTSAIPGGSGSVKFADHETRTVKHAGRSVDRQFDVAGARKAVAKDQKKTAKKPAKKNTKKKTAKSGKPKATEAMRASGRDGDKARMAYGQRQASWIMESDELFSELTDRQRRDFAEYIGRISRDEPLADEIVRSLIGRRVGAQRKAVAIMAGAGHKRLDWEDPTDMYHRLVFETPEVETSDWNQRVHALLTTGKDRR